MFFEALLLFKAVPGIAKGNSGLILACPMHNWMRRIFWGCFAAAR
jgi:hypothetical protein